jgi:hypothetical protein
VSISCDRGMCGSGLRMSLRSLFPSPSLLCP